ncbi:MAG: hypothetical protein WCY09_09480 [Candidatus Omnitrophota bacterium]
MAEYRKLVVGAVQAIPTGGDLVRGFVAPWSSKVMYTVGTESDDVKELGAIRVREYAESTWRTLYFFDYNAAVAAAKAIGAYNPATISHFEAPLKDALIDKADKFDDPLAMEINLQTLRAKLGGYRYQMIFLPSAVAAAADLYGIPNAGFDLSELTDDSTIVTDEFQWHMVGNSDYKPDGEFHWTKSLLWKQRTELWASLGESDPKRYVTGLTVTGDKKAIVTSDTLRDCLLAVQSDWTDQWARLTNVADPVVDAKTKAGKRLQVLTINKLYQDKEEALADNGDDDGSVPVVANSSNTSSVPTAWKGLESEFAEELANSVSSGMNNQQMAEALGITIAEAVYWRKTVS